MNHQVQNNARTNPQGAQANTAPKSNQRQPQNVDAVLEKRREEDRFEALLTLMVNSNVALQIVRRSRSKSGNEKKKLQHPSEANFAASAKILLNIPKLTGNEQPRFANDWIIRFERFKSMHQWTDELALDMVRGHLAGRAADWFTAGRMDLMKWPKFCVHFRVKFVAQGSTDKDWKGMTDRVQLPGESAYKYACAKEALCAEIGLNFEYTKKQVILGLRSKKLSRALKARHHGSTEDLLKDIVKFENAVKRRNNKITKEYLATTKKE